MKTVLVILLLFSLPALYVYGTQEYQTITVSKSERVTQNSADGVSSKYLVFADEGVFENTDSLFRLKFSSSDLYNEIKEGKTYRCDTYGWRLPFLSVYPNLVDCEQL